MRKSKQEAALTRERIVTVAAAEFRQQGVVATGLLGLMSTAGLTHGGFYRHFESKEQLVTEASEKALADMNEHLVSVVSGKHGQAALKALVSTYLSVEHRDQPSKGCPLAALGSELARADLCTRDVATQGLHQLINLVAGLFEHCKPAQAHKYAMTIVATIIGAITTSRIVTDNSLSESLLRNAEDSIMHIWKASKPNDQNNR
jgi:TetR/AcrR family transcriptional repressor of nem operon